MGKNTDKLLRDNESLFVMADTIKTRKVKWLWPGMIPRGKITMLDGDPGAGKSLVTMDLAARLTSGTHLPDNVTKHKPMGVVLLCAEDDPQDTLVPRLGLAGADLGRVALLNQDMDADGNPVSMTFPEDADRIRKAIRKTGAGLLIIDPIMAYMGSNTNTNNDASVRAALAPLKDIAQSTNCSVLMVRHMNKSKDGPAMYRGGGSIAFTGLARSALIAAKDPENEGVVVIAQVKNNLSRMSEGYTYQIESAGEGEGIPYVEWLGRSDLKADELLNRPDSRAAAPQRDECAHLIDQLLREQDPYPSKELERLLREAGFGKNTWNAAKKQAGAFSIRVQKNGKTVGWNWTKKSPLKHAPKATTP